MASSSLTYALCILLCICSLQSLVSAKRIELPLYVHEVRGPNGTLLAAAGTGQGNASATGWGSFLVVENFVTAEPEWDETKVLGQFTGFAAMTTKGGLMNGGFLLLDQIRFGPKSKWSGSSITFTGNLLQAGLPKGPWELIVLGGTGYFRGYTGYVLSEPWPATSVPPRFAYKWVFYLKK